MAEAPLDFAALLPHVGVFGGVRRFLEIGNALVARGHTYTLYHPDGTAPDWLPFAGQVRALSDLGTTRHDVLMTADPGLREAFERAPAGVKLFYCVHKNLPPRDIATHRDWTLLANSSALRERLRRRYGVRAEDAIGGINVDMFRPEVASRASNETFRVLVYGRLSRGGKGSTMAVRAVERLARSMAQRPPAGADAEVPAVTLVLFDHVGTGNESDPRDGFACDVPYEFHVNLSQSELARLYTTCNVYLSAERRAGWNNTVAEAMACGVPVVCTRAGTGDLVTHGETAWLVRWRHPYFFARAVQRLARDVALRERLRRSALERVNRFSWERVAGCIEDVARRRLLARV